MLRGFVILAPILFVIYLFDKVFKGVAEVITTVVQNTPLHSDLQVVIVFILTIFLIFIAMYMVGRFSYSRRLTQLSEWLDDKVLSNVPVYSSLKLQFENSSEFLLHNHPPVFVKFGEMERPGFLMEEKPDIDRSVVFIPKNFNDFNGNIYVVPDKLIRYAQSDKDQFLEALDHLGKNLDIE